MTGQNVSITEAARNFSDFVNRVAYRGERFYLIRGKKRVASLSPAEGITQLSDMKRAVMDLPALSAEERQAWRKDLSRLDGFERG